jgi:two-component system chemotaxis sensor kinase CheA
MGTMDEGILAEFLTESFENLAQVEHDLVALERDPEDRKRLAGVFRAIHTIKGTCGFFGFTRLESVAHAGENLLSRLRCGELRLTPEMARALFDLVDSLRSILVSLEATRREGEQDFAPLIATLTRLDGASGAPPIPEALRATSQEAGADTPAPFAEVELQAPRRGLLDPLIESGRLDPGAVALAAQQQRLGDPRRIGEILVDNGALQPQEVLDALLAQGETPAQTPGEATIRVDVELLDLLMNLVGELVLARNQLIQKVAAAELADLPGTTQRLNLITSELQAGIMKTRMQPIAHLGQKLPRLVRDVSIVCGKEARLELEGIETELDRTILDAIRDPVMHLIRNAIDHGIETPEIRTARGKAVEGRIAVRAVHEGGKVLIEVEDDGGGIPIDRIKAKALAAGLVPPERAARMSERDWAQVIFLPGFSTAERITSVSGRGVGMDVVKTNVERVGGAIDVDSTPGAGTTVRIRIPLTLAIVPALIVSAGFERYAIPQVHLIELVRVEADEVDHAIARAFDAPVLRYRGGLLPLVHLRQALDVTDEPTAPVGGARLIAVLHADAVSFGLVVDQVLASQEIVVKSLGEPLRQIPVFAGATILGDGRVALILDVPGLARHSGITLGAQAPAAPAAPASEGLPIVELQTLILCRAAGVPVAISQSDIARLEEFPASAVERLGERRVVQYRGGLLPLVSLGSLLGFDETSREGTLDAAPETTLRVVVYEREGRSLGLTVEEILEILEERIAPGIEAPRLGVRGSAVIRGRATDLLDLDLLLGAGAGLASPSGAGHGAWPASHGTSE